MCALGVRRLIPAAAAVVIGAWSLEAGAADEVEPVRIEYEAVAGCPSGSEFLASIRARTSRVRAAEGDEPARTFQVKIDSGGPESEFGGELRVSDAGDSSGTAGTRAIRGQSCEEVFEALALFAALSVDPEASAEKKPSLPEPAPVEQAPPSPPDPEPASEPKPSIAKVLVPRQRPASEWRGMAGVHTGAMSAGLSSKLWLLVPFVDVGVHALVRSGLEVAPTLRLSFSMTAGESTATSQGYAELAWTTVRLDGCPLELRIVTRVSARPCATASLGILSGSGQDIDNPKDQTALWSSLGGLFRLEWQVLGPALLEASAGIDVPLQRDSFYFEPNTPLYRVPRALAFATIGFGIHLL